MNPSDIPGIDVQSIVRDLDPEDLQAVVESIDPDDIQPLIQSLWADFVAAELVEVRQVRQQKPSVAEMREGILQLPKDRQQELFDEALQTIIEIAMTIRQNPDRGFRLLKQTLRDPKTVASLQLVFVNEDHIDPDYSRDMMESAGLLMQMIGVAIAPEAYTREERLSVLEHMDWDPEDVGLT